MNITTNSNEKIKTFLNIYLLVKIFFQITVVDKGDVIASSLQVQQVHLVSKEMNVDATF